MDACVVLSTGVVTGIVSASALCERLARDRIIPQVMLYRLPVTGARFVAILAFVALCAVLYASSGANLQILYAVYACFSPYITIDYFD